MNLDSIQPELLYHSAVDSTLSYIQDSWVKANNYCKERLGQEIVFVMEKVQNIAFSILAYIGTGLLFLSNSSVFVIGFSAAIISTEKMDGTLQEIQKVYDKLMKEKNFTRLSFIVTGAVLAWPITMAVCAFFTGAHYGLRLKKS